MVFELMKFLFERFMIDPIECSYIRAPKADECELHMRPHGAHTDHYISP